MQVVKVGLTREPLEMHMLNQKSPAHISAKIYNIDAYRVRLTYGHLFGHIKLL